MYANLLIVNCFHDMEAPRSIGLSIPRRSAYTVSSDTITTFRTNRFAVVWSGTEMGCRWTRRRVEGRAGPVCRKCGRGMRPRAGKDGRVGTWRGVWGCFSANAAGGCGRGRGKVAASACGKACRAGFPQMRPGRGCRERTPIGCREGGGSREQEAGNRKHGTGAGNRSRESEAGSGAGNRSGEPERGKRGGVGFFKAVSGFFTILAGWNEIIIQTIWLKR